MVLTRGQSVRGLEVSQSPPSSSFPPRPEKKKDGKKQKVGHEQMGSLKRNLAQTPGAAALSRATTTTTTMTTTTTKKKRKAPQKRAMLLSSSSSSSVSASTRAESWRRGGLKGGKATSLFRKSFSKLNCSELYDALTTKPHRTSVRLTPLWEEEGSPKTQFNLKGKYVNATISFFGLPATSCVLFNGLRILPVDADNYIEIIQDICREKLLLVGSTSSMMMDCRKE